MKLLTKVLIVLCVVVVACGSLTLAVVNDKPMPAAPNVAFEDEPEANPLRVNLQVDGVEGCRFYIQSPVVAALNKVYVSAFGASPENADNSAALNSAFEYCRNNPGTHLVFDGGVYYVSNRLLLQGITDALIDGNGSKIVYDYGSGVINIEACNCLKLCDLTLDWDWDKLPLSAIAKAVDVKGEKHTLDFIFDDPEFAIPEMFYAITQCEDDGDTYGEKGAIIESYDGQNPEVVLSLEKISENTIRLVHNGTLDRFGGHKFILRSIAYGGAVMHLGNRSRDITLEGLKLYGGTGMGIIVGERSSHFALRNIFIGPDPEYANKRFTSLDADAVHINDSDGCFLIEGCDFSRQGDDDVNINSGIGWIHSVDGRTVEFEADGSMESEIGDAMLFRDKNFGLIEGFKATIESCEEIGGGVRIVTFKEDLPKAVKKGAFLYNADCTGNNYVIRNNYFHEHRARGLLLQTSNGLIENNRFYKTTHDAIRIVMDINGVWHEGTGADNIVIRNNVFEQCAYTGPEVIEVGTHLLDQSNGSYAFTNIVIKDNEFKDICNNLLAINNVNNFVFSGNTITLGDVFRYDVGKGRMNFLSYCANIDFSDNTYTDVNKNSFARIARSDSLLVWIRVNVAMRRKGGKK